MLAVIIGHVSEIRPAVRRGGGHRLIKHGDGEFPFGREVPENKAHQNNENKTERYKEIRL